MQHLLNKSTFPPRKNKSEEEEKQPKVSRELARSGFEEGSKALMPGLESNTSQGFSLKKNEEPKKNQQVPEKNEGEDKKEGEEREKFKFGSTLGLNKFAKERGGTRDGILAKLKKGHWMKLMEAQRKYEKELGQAVDKGQAGPKTLKSLARKCGSLVESCESYIKDKTEQLENTNNEKEELKYEEELKRLTQEKWSVKGKERLKVEKRIGEHIMKGPGFADPISEQRRTAAMLMLPRLKVELVQLQSGQLPSKGQNDTTRVQEEGTTVGKGALNAPTLNKFQQGNQQVEGVFKKDQGVDVSHHTKSKHLSATSAHGMTERAVGSSLVDRHLGTNVVAKTDFGIVDGKLGQVMEKGEGVTPTIKVDNNKQANKEIDYTDPELQRQLYALEWVDFFTGEGDRHGQNLMVKQGEGKTKVTGIDNDMGFTEDSFGVTQGGKDPSKFPSWIDATLAQRIMAKDFTLNNYVKMLEPILPARSLEVAKARFPKVVEHAEKLIKNGKVINKKGENLLGQKGQTMEWGSKELESAMEEDKSRGLLSKFWQAQKGKSNPE